MSESFGTRVSRTLSAEQRQFQSVIWAQSNPPLDSELNLMSQIDTDTIRRLLQSQSHSGFLLDPLHTTEDYVTNPLWSNQFQLGRNAPDESAPFLWAYVNGWIIPITGTDSTTTSNIITLYPPPASDSRVDLVFLEVWQAIVSANPSTENKPSASTLYRYGNSEYGGTNLTDDLKDPTIRCQTTQRIQLQYRIRVFGQGSGAGSSVALDVYPDGLGDPNIVGQGSHTSPQAGFPFANMRETTGDAALWRAGDGDPDNDLGTVDGYSYAIPLCAVFRRNSTGFTAIEAGGNANHNGAYNRNPNAVSREDARVFQTLTLTSPISRTAVGAIAVAGIASSPFDAGISPAETFLQLEGEIIGPVASFTSSTITLGAGTRGRAGTQAQSHAAGTAVLLYNPRPDQRWADEVSDIYDLRKAIGNWDHMQLLLHNLNRLFTNQLRTCYKQSSSGETEGTQVVEVSYMSLNTTVPNSVTAVDGPDGIRTIWSDAAVQQSDVTVLCECNQPSGTVLAFDAGVAWDVAADFKPSGFIAPPGNGITNGSVVFLYLGGANGSEGARGTFRTAGTKGVRFLAPQEGWKTPLPDASTGRQTPITIRWLDVPAMSPPAVGEDSTAGPMFPSAASNFETPFIVLGGVLNDASVISSPVPINVGGSVYDIDLTGLDFDTPGGWWNGTDITALSPDGISNSILRGERTLYDLLTKGGTDVSGNSSEVYVVLYGDSSNGYNNGAFQVLGCGTAGYTTESTISASRVRVRALSAGFTGFTSPFSGLTAQLRSPHTNAEDEPGGYAGGRSSLAIVFTDIEGTNTPWEGVLTAPPAGKMVINTTLQYTPGRGSTPRVPDSLWRVAMQNAGIEYLREPLSAVDSSFPSAAGVPAGETQYEPTHVQTWNRLPSLGLGAGAAPAFGGEIVAYSEQDRESEVFFDCGSKTLLFRPFQNKVMSLYPHPYTGTETSLFGNHETYGGPIPAAGTAKDGAGIFDLTLGVEVPAEYMPRFGRQDIPYHTGTTFLPGINHLFLDLADTTSPGFKIIGGHDNAGTAGVTSMFVQTGNTGLNYGEYAVILGPSTGAYQGRLYRSSEVISSDLGRGLRGIQLPPYLGISRLFGVYDRRDYLAQGNGAWNADRITPATTGATNLLRKGATKQTLFILRDGASDVLGETGGHTYIVPSEAVDITASPTYVSGETFEDLEYVLEFTCFGFAHDWITGNNLVFARKHDSQGNAVVSTDLLSVNMMIPSAASKGDTVYVGYTRTPYQGDPYMTRNKTVRTTSDYSVRYGQVAMSDAYKLNAAIEQFDSVTGDLIPEMPNRRGLEVLASVDFYTTLGTGKVGGVLYPGTPLDVGYVADHLIPSSSTQPLYRTVPKAYTEQQKDVFASVSVEFLTNAGLLSGTSVRVTAGEVQVSLVAGTDFAVGADKSETAFNLAEAIMDSVLLQPYVSASARGSIVDITSNIAGSAGNTIRVRISDPTKLRLAGKRNMTQTTLSGGVDTLVNAGDGTSQIRLTGLTERLPLGILCQDSDFLCENPLGDSSSSLVVAPTGMQPVQQLLPLSSGAEYTRLIGGPGHSLVLSDGSILQYEAYNSVSSPSGTRSFRLYRGGGSAFVASDPVPGAPIDWGGSLPLASVLKGAVLSGKAFLVRNMEEEAFTVPKVTTHGDEIQMVIVTYGHYDCGRDLSGTISPTGYGEGYAAADRYRCEGHPQICGSSHRVIKNLDAEPAIYPGGIGVTTTSC